MNRWETAGNRRRCGLTLMELVVVLVILIALAGILIPLLPSFLERAHVSSCATNIPELNKAMQTYQSLYYAYPDEYDALIEGSGLFTRLPADAPGNYVGGQLGTMTLNAGTLAALQHAGIRNLWYMSSAPGTSATFSPYDPAATVPTPLATGSTVATLDGLAAVDKLGVRPAQATATFVIFGLGKRCTIVGRTIAEPPTHFGDRPEISAGEAYGRYGVVFQLTDATGTALSKARFLGVVALHDNGIENADDHMEEHYRITREQQ
ncbi:MAG: type II secretion system protein [Gemmataceae bacterium]